MMSTLRLALVASLFVAGCQTLPYAGVAPQPRVAEVEDGSVGRASQNARVYDAAVQMVSRRFYDRAEKGRAFRDETATRRDGAIAQPDETGFYTAFNGVLQMLDDDHTRAEGPSFVARSVQWGTSVAPTFGIQFVLGTHEKTGEQLQYVMRVRPDGPAARAGVKPGWLARTLNGEPWAGSQVHEDRDNVAGFEDHEGTTHLVTMNPAHLKREIGYLTRRSDGVAVMGFSNFDSVTADWLQTQLAGLRADPPLAIVLDLRGNPGGTMDAASRMLGLFFADQFRFASIGTLDLESRVSRTFGFMPTETRPYADPWLGPVSIVQSNLSASAAEVFAAAIQECRRGTVVGQRSAGAVVVSQQFWLPDGGLLNVGVTELRTISGKEIEKAGVTPDVTVVPTHEDVRTGRDVMVEAAAAAALAEVPVPDRSAVGLCDAGAT